MIFDMSINRASINVDKRHTNGGLLCVYYNLKVYFLVGKKKLLCNKKHQCSSDQMKARIKLCSSLTSACRIHFMGEPLQDDAAVVRFGCEKDIGILLEDLRLQKDTCFQKAKKTFAFFDVICLWLSSKQNMRFLCKNNWPNKSQKP